LSLLYSIMIYKFGTRNHGSRLSLKKDRRFFGSLVLLQHFHADARKWFVPGHIEYINEGRS
jgi:hypothetical protein